MADEYLTERDYQDAVFSQTACNLSGIVFAFARVMQKICNEAERDGHGTDWRNSHPIARLYAEQIAHLSGGREWKDAHDECEKKGNNKERACVHEFDIVTGECRECGLLHSDYGRLTDV